MTVYTASSESRVNTYTTSYQDDSVTTALTGGGYVVAWRSWDQDTDGNGVFLQVYGADGTATGSETQVNSHITDHQMEPAITALDTGGFVVAWTSVEQDGDSAGIYQLRYDADGVALGGEVLVNQITAGIQDTPEITTMANGDYVIAWRNDNDNISVRLFSADGTARTGELTASTDTANNKIYHDLLALEGGGFVGNTGQRQSRHLPAALRCEWRPDRWRDAGQHDNHSASIHPQNGSAHRWRPCGDLDRLFFGLRGRWPAAP